MKKIYSNILCIVFVFLAISACDTTDLNLTQNPNALKPDEATVDGYINAIQVDFGRLVANLEIDASRTVRILNLFGRDYQNAFEDNRFNNEWEEAYQKIMKDIKDMTPLAEEANQYRYLGMTQVIEAYVLITLVDFFGPVPYSQTFQSPDNLNPKADGGKEVYVAAVELLDAAIENFGKKGDALSKASNDLFYGGNWINWIKAANSIKMKIYVTTRLVDNNARALFDAIVKSGDYIQDNAEDFQFSWATSFNNPDARHPNYVSDYTPSGADTYMSNWYMDYMLNNKRNNGNTAFEGADPRMKYYFYRQVPEVPQNNPNLINCVAETAPTHYDTQIYPFCSLSEGYWGRDHGDDDGTPPDTQRRTTFGVYPAGGRFDDDSYAVIASISLGAGGAGITPIMLASWTDAMRSEMALIGGDVANAGALLQSAIEKSFAKVRAFGLRDANADFSTAPPVDDDAAYVREVGQLFAAADNDDERLDILGAEYFVMLWGNGIDAFNFYRRTGGRPSTLQPSLAPESESGLFFRSFLYPTVFVDRNASVSQKKDVLQKVFWDTAPDQLLAN